MKKSTMMRITLTLLFAIVSLGITKATATNSDENWKLTTTDLNSDYTGAPVANGTIGILPWREPFSIRHLILNHIFERNDGSGVNCTIKGINPLNLTMRVDGEDVNKSNISEWKQTIDMKDATHNTEFTALNKVKVEYTVVAPRCLPFCAIIRIHLKALSDVKIMFDDRVEIPEGEYRNATKKYHELHAGGKYTGILRTDAETAHGRYGVAAALMYIAGESDLRLTCTANEIAHAGLKLKAGEETTLSLAASICTTHDFSDPYSEAMRELIYINLQGVDQILEQHKRLWAELWQGDIEIEGDDDAQKVVRFALYNLYSYCRKGTALSISPMGLSSQGYNGHVFWDSEIWMYPPMLLLNQDIARSMIDYRTNRLNAAKTRASLNGYEGAMFPWESDDNGEESTPCFATTGQFEHHITGDIAFGAWNYFRVTQDKQWLREKGWPLIKATAEFWASRVTKNENGTYSIKNVVGADEYAEGVDDNAYTNAAAITNLRCAIQAGKLVGEETPAAWKTIADGIVIHKLSNGVTAEYQGYNGQTIKQGDANLLAYPFSLVKDKAQIRKDLDYYVEKIDTKHGPAMAFGVFTVIYARIGDKAGAENSFRRSYEPNVRPPFGVLAETPTSHNPYFATGAGSLLQGVLNGFGGLEITDKGIVQHPSVLPKSWKRLTIKGVGKERKTFVVTQKN